MPRNRRIVRHLTERMHIAASRWIGPHTMLCGPIHHHRKRGLAFHDALEPRTDWSYDRYHTGRVSAPARHAAYSANLLLLIALIGGPVTGRELFPDGLFPASDWRRHAMLWRSQFTGEGWKNLAAALRLQRIWHAGDREIRVSLEPWRTPRLDPFWTFRIPPEGERRKGHGGWYQIQVEDIC